MLPLDFLVYLFFAHYLQPALELLDGVFEQLYLDHQVFLLVDVHLILLGVQSACLHLDYILFVLRPYRCDLGHYHRLVTRIIL